MSSVIGIDFGTTNSLFSLILSENPFFFRDGKMPHPSMVCYANNPILCGTEAKKRFEGATSAEAEGIVRSPKRLLGKGIHYVMGRQMEPTRIVADLMRYLRDHALGWGVVNSNFDRAVVSIPVAMDGRQRVELRDALLQAGINIVQFVHEPLAALYAHFRAPELGARTFNELTDELALVFDWGGGTLDLTLCHLGSESISQVANFGDNEVGGDYIDEAVLRYVLEKVIEGSGGDQAREVPGARARLLEQCEQAKILLSKSDTALIYVPEFFLDAQDNDIEVVLTREQYDAISETYIDRGIKAIGRLLERLNIDRRRISLCLATGGMINTPSIHGALIQLFGSDRLHISDRGDCIISEGCAWVAHDLARLKLAKPLEAVEARETYLSIFKEGDALPLEGEAITQNLSMYCVDPRDGLAKIKLTRPRHLGKAAATDPRDVYGCLSVRVDSQSKPFRERIQVKFLIDHDLIVRVEAESLLLNDKDSLEILDLEFSLDSGMLRSGVEVEADSRNTFNLSEGDVGRSGVVLRANVTSRKDLYNLVPGELLYQSHRRLFDRRNPNPLPELLHEENLYYKPCSLCGRRFNHPECNCGSLLAY